MIGPKDGGPAFPRAGFEGPEHLEMSKDGMSMRDYFAAAALTGLLADKDYDGGGANDYYDKLAHDSYQAADEMLSVRAKSHQCPACNSDGMHCTACGTGTVGGPR